ncbi:alpha-L-fucosidase [Allonocardiopsis opalescens]|uniref:alpha-L-fucosidase n=1 Tax=Allonocardiopsis opalescens TaxID=1144618 RepID=A0A2T0Q6P6_9ACTN|nr:alpha-L-fucosidase [Allonocardiopsis opalescens]PRX99500.1 alpha-L-fucosidase [Allonocardiopsis opalescens]
MSVSSAERRVRPTWFDDAKLGVMVVWTPAAVPAFAPLFPSAADWERMTDEESTALLRDHLPFAEMYLNQLHIPTSATARHHAEHHPGRDYDSFAAEFRAGLHRWDPRPWAELFAAAGCRYVVLTVKHQDGFLLWPSAAPNPHKRAWQAERDIAGELAEAVRARGMRFGVLYSGGLDFTFTEPPASDDYENLPERIAQDPRYSAYADAHWRELIERYRPSVLWNDAGYPAGARAGELIAWYREQVPDGVVNDRFGPHPAGSEEELADFATLEYQRDYANEAPAGRGWESCRGLGSSFGYNRQETDGTLPSRTELIHEFVDCVAHGGNFLPAVGPTASGRIPWIQAERLLALGWWLRENGEAVYGTRPWLRAAGTTRDGLGVRYTRSADAVHAIVLGTPAAARVELDVTVDDAAAVTLAGDRSPLEWAPTGHGVAVRLPEVPDERPALVLRISPAEAVRPVAAERAR